MLRFLLCMFVFISVSTGTSRAAVSPFEKNTTSSTAGHLKTVFKLKAADIEKFTEKKLTVKQKLQIKLTRLAHRMIPGFEEGIPTPKQVKQGTSSVRFGSAAILLLLLGLVVPIVGLFSLPLGIAALVLGIKSIKGNGNTQALLGIISGALVTCFWLIGIIAIIVLISTGGLWG